MKSKSSNLIILSLYTAASVHFNRFRRVLGTTAKNQSNPESEFLVCGGININYINKHTRRK
jgi:hypothetical protein